MATDYSAAFCAATAGGITGAERAFWSPGFAVVTARWTRRVPSSMKNSTQASNPANLPRYEALGFRRRAEFGPVDGPLITTMWREAC